MFAEPILALIEVFEVNTEDDAEITCKNHMAC